MAENSLFWGNLYNAFDTSEGFTVNFWLTSGHVIKDVAVSPIKNGRVIDGERITSAGDRVLISIRSGDVAAYEIEES